MSRAVRENNTSMVEKASSTDISPSLMVIPSYSELQQERSMQRVIARSKNVSTQEDRFWTLRTKSIYTQTSISCIDRVKEARYRKQIAHQDQIISTLNDKLLKVEKLNTKLHLQLIESSFAHSDKDQDIVNLKSELAKANSELKKKDIFLVDYNRAKKSESKMVAQLAKQHLIIVRLTQDLNSCRNYISLMCKKIPKELFRVAGCRK
ncbi:uncharacterized protein LOC110184250 [Drosophila serrata]|uniref:uncharacterized protein LOC110184250 n=1 Tax=Drosophila serrata TaxID=7274 RepID=UPI000A1D3468|nr:uncharacterized protein LOC110184250 [Drosophila serrata]